MGLCSWLRERFRRTDDVPAEASAARAGARAEEPETFGCSAGSWVEVPPFVEVDPKDHAAACVVASAIAAGDRPESTMVVRRVSIANDEHRRVACVATAIAAEAYEMSSFKVKKIYKQMERGSEHAA